MFQTVRHWWGSGRGRVTARLFAFELLVVILGVLIAQAVAGWVRDRGDDREGQALAASAVEFAGGSQRVNNYWRRHGQCLRDHVGRIARLAATGGTLSAQEIGRPGLPALGRLDFNADDWRKIDGVAGNERARAYSMLSLNAETARGFAADIGDQWARLRLLDPEIGPPSEGDRVRVREAAIVIDNRLRWLMFNQVNWRRIADRSGIAATGALPASEQLVDACGLLKEWR